MPIYTPIIIKSGSVEVFSEKPLTFNNVGGKWQATLPSPKAAAVHLAVLQQGQQVDFFVDDAGPGERRLKAQLKPHRAFELEISSSGTTITVFDTRTHEPPGHVQNRKFYEFKHLKVDQVQLWGGGSKLVEFDDLKEMVVLVQTPDVVCRPLRHGGTVGTGAVFAAVGFVAGLAAGAFLAGGLDDGGW